jgi:hypothetical protein
VAHPAAARGVAALLAAGCIAVLAVAVSLDPRGRLYGTHSDLVGMGPCGMLVMTGLPCPTCGMTTSFAYFVRGQWLMSMYAQPMGFALALGTAVTLLTSLTVLVRGRWPRVQVLWLTPYRVFLALLVLFVASWIFKIVSGLADGSLPYPGNHGGPGA